MLIVEVKESESIDRALKRYKRKFLKSGLLREIRERREYKKPSRRRRSELLKAQYREQMKQELEN